MASPNDTGGLLTSREDEVLELLRLGLTNADIAGRLGLTVDGVKYHVSQIIAKLGVRNRYEAAHWPERPPWWLGGAAPIASVTRQLGRLTIGAPAVARAAIVVVVISVAGGLGLLVLLLTRSNSDATPDVPAWDQAAVPAPVFLSEPARLSGDGWTFESRVSNLGALETVVLAKDFPGEIDLVDVRTGAIVANGTFGHNYDPKVRGGTLLVTHSPVGFAGRQLIFDMSGAAPRLAAELTLPERVGYKGNFAPSGVLSQDGSYLFIPLRSWIVNTLQCSESGGDGKLCTKHGIAVIDLEQRRLLRSIAAPEQCYSLRLKESEQNVPLVSCDEHWYSFDDDTSTLREEHFPPYALFVSRSDDRSTRSLLENGTIVDERANRITTLQPDGEHGLSLSGNAWPIGDGRIVDTFYRKHSTDLVRYLSIIDLRRARVERSLRLPDTTEDVLVLDPSRAVVLVQSNSGHELRQLDLDTMRWAATVLVPDAPEGPLALTR